MEDFDVILVGEQVPDAPPRPAFERIWPRVASVLRHYAWLNTDEARVRDLQFGILNDGAFLVPSLFGEGGDLCRRSFFSHGFVFYQFAAAEEEYFWITAQLDRCYALGALYFPGRRTALALYPYTISPDLLRAFEAERRGLDREAGAAAGGPVVVTGSHHMIHHLWNELPALDRAVGAGLSAKLRVVATYQPLGPLDRLFPELEGRVEARSMGGITDLHREVEMFAAIGSWSIPRTTQARVIRLAHRLASNALFAAQLRYQQRHWPLFWISVKPPQRTLADQAATLAALIEGLHARYPRAGFLLDGVSYPWDYQTNPNYADWFRTMMETAARETGAIMDQLVALLPEPVRAGIRRVTDLPVQDEITWAGLADFYVCHGGSMQNKLGWLHAVPGVIHSNTRFMASARGMIPPVEHAPSPSHYVPDEMIVDDDPADYTPLQLARKDQNYRFRSDAEFVAFVLAAFEASVPPAGHLRGHGPDDVVPPMIGERARIALAMRPADSDVLAKVADAGQVLMQDGHAVQVMHNGLRLTVDPAVDRWTTRLVELCRGHRDAPKERMFAAILATVPDTAGMVEVGDAGAYYSLWFLQDRPGRRAIVLGRDAAGNGRTNAARNGLAPDFVMAAEVPFVEQALQARAWPDADILYCDVPGQELAVLEACRPLFTAGRVSWVLVSTHAELVSGDPLTHQRCLALLQDAGASIEGDYDAHESFSGAGMIAARFGPAPAGWAEVPLSRARYSESIYRNPLNDLAESRRAPPPHPR